MEMERAAAVCVVMAGEGGNDRLKLYQPFSSFRSDFSLRNTNQQENDLCRFYLFVYLFLCLFVCLFC